jgi:protein subunit release factor A
MYQLETFVNGNMDSMIEALQAFDKAERLQAGE